MISNLEKLIGLIYLGDGFLLQNAFIVLDEKKQCI